MALNSLFVHFDHVRLYPTGSREKQQSPAAAVISSPWRQQGKTSNYYPWYQVSAKSDFFLVCFCFLKKFSFPYAINARIEPWHSCWPQREKKENPGESARCTPTWRKPQRHQGTIHTIKFFAGTKAPSLHSHSLLNQQSCKSYFYRHLFSLSHKIVWKHFPNSPVAIVQLTPPPQMALLRSHGPCHWIQQSLCCLTTFLLLWKPEHEPKLVQRL